MHLRRQRSSPGLLLWRLDSCAMQQCACAVLATFHKKGAEECAVSQWRAVALGVVEVLQFRKTHRLGRGFHDRLGRRRRHNLAVGDGGLLEDAVQVAPLLGRVHRHRRARAIGAPRAPRAVQERLDLLQGKSAARVFQNAVLHPAERNPRRLLTPGNILWTTGSLACNSDSDSDSVWHSTN